MSESFFNNSHGVKLDVSEVVDEVMRFMDDAPERKYTITIGTDSELLRNGNADFVTAIVVHRIGNGGRYFWRRFSEGPFYTLRDRIIQEVIISLDAGKGLLERLRDRDAIDAKAGGIDVNAPVTGTGNGRIDWHFEIHADVGASGETKAMIQEVVGMIRAHNFEPRTKPESYAASAVADRHV